METFLEFSSVYLGKVSRTSSSLFLLSHSQTTLMRDEAHNETLKLDFPFLSSRYFEQNAKETIHQREIVCFVAGSARET